MSNIVLFEKDYDYEGLYDLSRDMGEAICEQYNPLMDRIPADEFGMLGGTFKVSMVWVSDEE